VPARRAFGRCMAERAGEWLAAHSARRVAPAGAAQVVAGPSVTVTRSPSVGLPVAEPQTRSWPHGGASGSGAQDVGLVEQPVERPMTKSAALDAIEAAWKIALLSPWRISNQAPR
jgi:hypothetical protein